MTKAQLQEECKRAKLPTRGSKTDLLARLGAGDPFDEAGLV